MKKCSQHSIFSSSELEAQVSFPDHVVCRPSVCKLFIFSSSSPETLAQFQPHLTQSIIGWRGFKFEQMKDLFLRKMIVKIHWSHFQNHLANFNQTWQKFKFLNTLSFTTYQLNTIQKSHSWEWSIFRRMCAYVITFYTKYMYFHQAII